MRLPAPILALALTALPLAAVFAQPVGGNMDGTGGPIAGIEKLTGGKDLPPGPFAPTWESLKANFQPPAWFADAKFGIFLHWGLFSVAAHHSEWWVRFMYAGGADTRWQIAHYGPLDGFGYKDFIPLFRAEKWNPAAWAALFQQAGARYVMLTAEHSDGWANWASDLTPWNAGAMGPKRDLVGDLAQACRAAGLRFGVSNHRMEHYDFIRPAAGLATDLNDPATQDFYWTANHSDALYLRFLDNWLARNFELIDKYQPDLLYFDNGVNGRRYDPLKLRVAAYYYNRAAGWGKQVALNTKRDAYLAGSLRDYERGRAPDLRPEPWQEDTSIAHNTWGYTDAILYRNAGEMVRELVDCVSKNGNYLLNLAPRADGTIPAEQELRLREIGEWLRINGEAIYGSRPWTRYGEGPTQEPANGERGITNGMLRVYTPRDLRFTIRGDTLYAILFAWPADGQAVITSLALSPPNGLASGAAIGGQVENVELLGSAAKLTFTRDADGLKVKLPAIIPCDYAYVLKITGLKLK
jgi:alpha-L-fucosidase